MTKPVPAVSDMDGESRKNSEKCFRCFSRGHAFENIEKFNVFDFEVDRKRRTAVWKPYAIEALLFSFPMAQTARLVRDRLQEQRFSGRYCRPPQYSAAWITLRGFYAWSPALTQSQRSQDENNGRVPSKNCIHRTGACRNRAWSSKASSGP